MESRALLYSNEKIGEDVEEIRLSNQDWRQCLDQAKILCKSAIQIRVQLVLRAVPVNEFREDKYHVFRPRQIHASAF